MWAHMSLVLLAAAVRMVECETPNILFILADDLNYDLVLNHRSKMPALTKHFIENGVVSVEFFNHVAASPVCGPSRSSLLSGALAYPCIRHSR